MAEYQIPTLLQINDVVDRKLDLLSAGLGRWGLVQQMNIGFLGVIDPPEEEEESGNDRIIHALNTNPLPGTYLTESVLTVDKWTDVDSPDSWL